jgi:hypothetical protein
MAFAPTFWGTILCNRRTSVCDRSHSRQRYLPHSDSGRSPIASAERVAASRRPPRPYPKADPGHVRSYLLMPCQYLRQDCSQLAYTGCSLLRMSKHRRSCGLTQAPGDCWRLWGVHLDIEDDPGKDDCGVTPKLCRAVSKRLGCKDLPAEALTVVRKSFDARRRERRFTYVVDVSAAAAAKAGAWGLQPKQGSLERCGSSLSSAGRAKTRHWPEP